MAGHSQFKNIMHRKGAQDKKRAKVFGKLIRELTVAARAGLPDPDSNPRLRTAFVAARAANMPNETMERAIKRGAGDGGGEAYAEVRYEGYGPGGVAIIVEALTNNRNRTAGEVRSAFAKLGGTLGETGSVAFQFNRVGLICYPAEAGDAEALFEAALDAGADDCASLDDGHEITTAPEALHEVRDGLEQRIGMPQSAELTWRALASVEVGEDDAANLIRLLEVLDDNEDVQSVAANYDMSEDELTQLTA